MSPTIRDEFYMACCIEHDGFCADGAECARRESHIVEDYMPQAMAEEIGRLRRALHEATKTPDATKTPNLRAVDA